MIVKSEIIGRYTQIDKGRDITNWGIYNCGNYNRFDETHTEKKEDRQ